MKDKIIMLTVAVLGVVAFTLAIVIMVTGGNKNTNNSETPEITATAENVTEAPTNEPTPEPTEEPSGSLAGITVCIDPGHQAEQMTDKEDLAPWDNTQKQKVSSGTQGAFTNNTEYEINLQIGLKIRDALVAEGANVVMTRETNDVHLSNIDRAKIGNECNADVVLRIHCNGIDNESVSGMETWVRGNGTGTAEYKALGAYEKKLAQELLDTLCSVTGAKKRNVNTSDNYTGLNWSEVPSIILELGFMSNETDDRNLGDPAYQDKIASGIVQWLQNSTVLKRD